MSLLPTQGTCSYNGYTFPVEHETLSLTAIPVQDQAKRTISHVVYSIVIHWKDYVNVLSNMNSRVDTIRKQLTAQAGAFRYEDKGLGNISVNVPGQDKKDVVWGPVPKMLRLKQIGINAIDGVWQIDVAIPECSAASFSDRIMEFNFKTVIDIDTSGYSRRVYSGYIRIPMTRESQDNRRLPDSVDRYRDKIYPKTVPGFRRIPGQFTIDESKTRLDFQVIDQEVGPNFPPPGAVEATASHSYQCSPYNFVTHSGTIEAEYEIIRGLNTGIALNMFKALVRSRIAGLRKIVGAGGLDQWLKFWGKGLPPGDYGIIPVQFSSSEPEIYGKKKAKFSLTYHVITTIIDFMIHGLWRPTPESNWSIWSRSMSFDAWTSRGNANLKITPDQDAIVDLCLPPLDVGKLSSNPPKDPPLPPSSPPDIFPPPTPWVSWLLYENVITFEDNTSTIVHTPLAESKLRSNATQNDPGFGTTQGFDPPTYINVADSVIQERSAPQYYVIMTGRAIRIGFEIPKPELISVGGVQAVPANREGDGFKMGIVGNIGMPVFAANWRLRYALPRAPDSLVPYPIPSQLSTTSTLRGRQR